MVDEEPEGQLLAGSLRIAYYNPSQMGLMPFDSPLHPVQDEPGPRSEIKRQPRIHRASSAGSTSEWSLSGTERSIPR
ncbi:hypothetical protein NGM37_60790, partial [Streptomyces sp. TRM76130]|nr:hypothetical protein [Streptomyces sp. TRM76130]